jgi:putative RNA 2'-phosphotransferase
MDYVLLSKEVSKALRHNPVAYGLTLDRDGWVEVVSLLESLKGCSPEWASLSEVDLHEMTARSAKRRHEVAGHRIRALYGHSTPERIEKEEKDPPELLYHGTGPNTAEAILRDGLRPMGRQYVHLSIDAITPGDAAKRKCPKPTILTVRAEEASKSGVAFYEGSPFVWLTDHVPAEFISGLSIK